MDAVVDRWLGPSLRAVDQRPTRDAIGDTKKFAQAALDAGFLSAAVEVVEETVRWESAERMVSMFTSWWDCAARMEGVDPDRRQKFADEAIETLKRTHPGAIETTGRNHVLFAVT